MFRINIYESLFLYISWIPQAKECCRNALQVSQDIAYTAGNSGFPEFFLFLFFPSFLPSGSKKTAVKFYNK